MRAGCYRTLPEGNLCACLGRAKGADRRAETSAAKMRIAGQLATFLAEMLRRWYRGVMDRSITRVSRITDRQNDDFVPGSPGDRLALVWQLTRESCSMSRHHDVERRLQRNVAVLSRRAR
jgi:hypothetical protein